MLNNLPESAIIYQKERDCMALAQKDIYAMASGELEYYFLIDGLIQLGRKAVSLDGYCFVIH